MACSTSSHRSIRTSARLCPDESGAFTSDHGWNLPADSERLAPLVRQARELGARVSLFMDPVPDAMEHAAALGADRIELYTEPYAQAFGTPAQEEVLDRYVAAADAARRVGLGVNAGHDLNRDNLAPFLRAVRADEVSIGHALIADALEFGLEATVRLYLAEIRKAGALSVIYGVGTDLIEIARIRAAYLRFGERFARRILGPRETRALPRAAGAFG